jgi:exopolysaccharide biosynthesis operon protein EpsL
MTFCSMPLPFQAVLHLFFYSVRDAMPTLRKIEKKRTETILKKRFYQAAIWLWATGCPLAYAAEAANDGNVVRAVVGGGVVHDSNLFRLPDFVDPQTALGKSTKSDTVTNAYVGLRIDKPYSLQRFQLDLTETMYRYENFSHLNYEALDYRGAWLWQLTPRLSGTLSAERKETLVPFEDFVILSQQRNVRKNDNRDFNVDWWASGGWHLLGGISQYEQRSEVPFLAEADFSIVDRQGGVRYESSAGNSLAFVQHFREGDYLNRVIDPVNQLDGSFDEDESEMRLKWRLGGHSSLDGRVGWLDRQHDNFPARDFSGLVGEIGYGWTPTGKLRLYVSAKRTIDAVVDAFSSYRINNTFSITPAWHASDKWIFSLRLDRIESDFRGAVTPLAGPARSDTSHSVKLMADWAPMRNVSLSTGVQRAERSSNIPTAEFDASVFLLRAGFKF